METRSTLGIKLLTSLFFYFSLNLNLIGQDLHPARYEEQSRGLSFEISRLNEQAVQLRSRARSAEPDMKTMLNTEAAGLEKQSMSKQVELYDLNYRYSLKNYSENKTRIGTLQKMCVDRSNANHRKYLSEESARNARLASELAEEAKAQPSAPLALGILDNANDKMDLAISQQKDLIRELENGSGKIAKNK